MMSRTRGGGGVLLVLALLLLLGAGHWAEAARPQQQRRVGRRRPGGEEEQTQELGLGEAREVLRSKGGSIRVWTERIEAFENAYVGVGELQLEENGLLLPQYADADKVAVVLEGQGWFGAVLPVRPEYRSHVVVRRVDRDDVVALPQGTVYWWYNDGNRRHRVLCASETTFGVKPGQTQQFGLAGGRQEKFGSILHGFSQETLARAWGVDEDTLRSILERQSDAGIVRVERKISFGEEEARRRRRYDEEEEEEERRRGRRHHPGDHANSAIEMVERSRSRFDYFEELKYDTRAQGPDVYVRDGGEAQVVNRHKLPALSAVGFSVGRGRLEPNAIFAPSFFRNAHQIMYVTRGNGRIEVSTGDGRRAFDEEVREGSVVAIPQFHPAIKIAGDQGLEWVNLITSDTPSFSFLAGRNSVYRGIPRQVLANALRVDERTFEELERGREDEEIIFPARREDQYRRRRRHDHERERERQEEEEEEERRRRPPSAGHSQLQDLVEVFLESGKEVVEELEVLPFLRT